MSESILDKIAEAVLYEGYLLYPYRPSAGKNRQQFTFGRIYPQAFTEAEKGTEPSTMQTECIAQGDRPSAVEVTMKFLHLVTREIHALAAPPPELAGREGCTFCLVPEILIRGKHFQTRTEAIERRVMPPVLLLKEGQQSREEHAFCLAAGHTFEPIREGAEPPVGVINRRHEALEGVMEIAAESLGNNLFKITVRLMNQTPLRAAPSGDREAVLDRAFVSTHVVFRARNCEFVSMTNPPPGCGDAVAGCRNSGLWPVLVGDEKKAERSIMLSSPIILPDYPQIALESAGTLFDETENDEILSLRIMTRAGEEKRGTLQAGEHAWRLLASARRAGGNRQASEVRHSP